MATFSIASALSNFSDCYATDGTYLYKRDGGVIKRWNPGADSDTDLSDGSSFPSGGTLASDPLSPFYWNGDLYVYTNGNGTTEDRAQVWQYDGSGLTWTKVFSNNTAQINGMMFSAAYVILFLDNVADGVYYTTDGTTWTNGSIFGSNAAYTSSGITCPDPYTSLDIATIIDISGSSAFRDVRFTGTAIADLGTRPGGDDFFNMAGPDVYWLEHQADGEYYYSNSLTSLSPTAPTGSGVFPLPSVNMVYSTGVDVSNGVYFFQSGAWVSVGTLAGADHFVRLNDGTLYVIDSSGDIFLSDEAVLPASPYALTHSAGGIPGSILAAPA